MTLFAGLKVSTLGLSAQGTKMGAISDNIANVNTVGYKRTDVQFSTLVTERIRETRFTPGGVTARPRQTVDQAGQLLGTGIATDFAVSGRGMFIVSEEPFTVQSTDGNQDSNSGGIFRDPRTSENGLSYTRAGSFRADQDGFLVNTAGYYLQGWAVNRNGDVTLDRLDPALINNSPGFADLQPVNVNRFSNIAEQTENLRTRANLPADFTVTEQLSRPNLDPRRAAVLVGPLITPPTAANPGGYTNIDSTDTIFVDNGGGAGTPGKPMSLSLSLDGGVNLTFTAAELAAAGFDPLGIPATNRAADFVTALDSLSRTLTDGRTVQLNGTLSGGGQLEIRATIDGTATTVTNPVLAETQLVGVIAAGGFAAAAAGQANSIFNDGVNNYQFDIPAAAGATAAQIAAAINGIPNDGGGGAVAAGAARLSASVNARNEVVIGLTVNGVRTDIAATPTAAFINEPANITSATVGVDISARTGAGVTNALTPDTDGANGVTSNIRYTDGTLTANNDTLVTINTPADAFTATVPGFTPTSAFRLTIDGETVIFDLNNTYDGVDAQGTLSNLAAELSGVTGTGAVSGASYDLEARVAGSDLVIIARRNGELATIDANFENPVATPTTTTVQLAAAGGPLAPTNLPEGVSQGVGAVNPGNTPVTGTYGDINTRRTQFELIRGAAGGSADFTTNSTVFDALGQPHQVQFQWNRYQSDVAGPNTWSVTLTDTSVSDVKIPLRGISNPDPTIDSDATVPRFITFNGRDGNDSLSPNNVTQSQTLFMKFNGDGSLEGVYTDPMLDPLSRVATRTNNPVDPLKMIQIAVGEVEIDATGAAGSGENLNLAVAKEINDGVAATDPAFVPSPFGTDGAKALVFDWDVGRPTSVRTAQDASLNGAYAGTGLDGLTQFDSGETTPALETFFTSQDGLRAGVLTGVGLDDDGFLTAFFDNGAQRKIYKVPLVSFVNFNGLINETGNIYRESRESGAAQINAAGQGFNGDLLGGALEQSNVELADEFTDMIITQQGFTANTRAITTTDEMLTDINNMVR